MTGRVSVVYALLIATLNPFSARSSSFWTVSNVERWDKFDIWVMLAFSAGNARVLSWWQAGREEKRKRVEGRLRRVYEEAERRYHPGRD